MFSLTDSDARRAANPMARPQITALMLLMLITGGPFFASVSWADDWQQWLGPRRDGTWAEGNITETFSANGPKLLWKQSIGGGYSGPAVASGCVILMDRVTPPTSGDEPFVHDGEIPRNKNFVRQRLPGKERVLCFRESDGKPLWQHEYDCPYSTVTTYATGPRATPTLDADRVYTLGAEGDLRCLRITDGSLIWSKDFKTDYNVTTPNWGFASPPLVDQDRLICIEGGESSGCVAFDKHTGRELWRVLTATEPGYSAPVIRTVSGHRQLLIWDSDAVHGLNPVSGEPFWSVNFPSTYAMSVATPQVLGASIFIMCFNGKSCVIDVGTDGNAAEISWLGDRRTGIDGVHNTAQLIDGWKTHVGHVPPRIFQPPHLMGQCLHRPPERLRKSLHFDQRPWRNHSGKHESVGLQRTGSGQTDCPNPSGRRPETGLVPSRFCQPENLPAQR